MDTGRAREPAEFKVSAPELGGRQTEGRLEAPAKRLQAVVPGVESDLGNALAGGLQPVRGPLVPQPPHKLHRPLAGDARKHPLKVKRGKAGDGGHGGNRVATIQVVLYL